MSDQRNYMWFYARSEDAEVFHKAESREDAITTGRTEFGGDSFYICEAARSVVKPNFHSDWIVEQLIEDLSECNEECWGEDGYDDAWTSEAEADLGLALEATVAEWLKRHPGKTWSVGDFRNEETIEATAEFAARNYG